MIPAMKSGADMTPSVLAIVERAASATSPKDVSSGLAVDVASNNARSS